MKGRERRKGWREGKGREEKGGEGEVKKKSDLIKKKSKKIKIKERHRERNVTYNKTFPWHFLSP